MENGKKKNDGLKLGNCKVFDVAEKKWRKSETLCASGTETRRKYKRAGGEKPIVGSLVCACPRHGPIQSRGNHIGDEGRGASFA